MEISDGKRDQLLKHLCRICSFESDTNALYSLIGNEELTDIGEMFRDCLHLDILSAEGFPDKICNHCQLQLKLFHAFLTKALKSHENFTDILEGLLAEDELQEVEIKTEQDYDEQEEEVTIEYSVKTETGGHVSQNVGEEEECVTNDSTSQDNEDFNVEYLDQEYINSFENEIRPVAKPSQAYQKSSPSPQVRTRGQKRRVTTSSVGSAQKRKYPFECKECVKGFLHKEIYQAHMRSIHQGLPAFSCPHCPKTFNEKPNFDYHMQDHNNHRPAQCNLCEKSFKNKQDLNSHLRVHNDIRKYMCDVCGKRFRSQSHMVYHRYSHFEERNFHCDECTQSFKSPHILKTHKNTIHSNIFRYECTECGKKFKRDHHLAHKRTHDNDRPKKNRRTAKKMKVETENNAENIDHSIEESSQNDDGLILIISE